MASIVLTTSSLMKSGYRLLVGGMDLSAFLRNPVMLDMHMRGHVIGRWENVRIEADALIADPVFDEKDARAAELKRKFEAGFLRAASVGFFPLALSDDPKDMLPGQRRATVIRSKLVEASIVDIGDNDDALRQAAFDAHLLTASGLQASIEEVLPILHSQPSMKLILAALGLPEGATEAQAVAAIEAIRAAQVATKNDAAAALVGLAEKQGLVTEANKPSMLKLAQADFQATVDMLSAAPKPAQDGGIVAALKEGLESIAKSGATPKGEDRASWDFRTWSSKAPAELMKMKAEKPQEYIELYKKQYHTEPDLS